ncbi:MAG: hypothetical protein DME14_20470, partial [Candidatus Rokuibacteriota bacterium]
DGVEASLVDATNPVVFVRAKDLGLAGTETPQTIDADRSLAARLEAIRVEAARRMGMEGSSAVPKVAVVASPADFTALDGARYRLDQVDLVARVISMGNCHRAFALTAAMCLAVAARLEGTVVHECTTGAARASGRPPAAQAGLEAPAPTIRLGHPSGVLPIDAAVRVRDGAPWAERVTVYRTARRLMEGFVRVP